MEKKSAALRSALNPEPAVIVSCRGKDGKNNAIAVAYAGNAGFEPPMIMIAIHPARYSHSLIKESGVFVANLVSVSMKKAFEYIGTMSGRDVDKLAVLGLSLGEGKKVNAPVLLDCPVSIECRVVESIKPGSHELFIGQVEYVHANADLVKPDGKIDWEKIDFLRLW